MQITLYNCFSTWSVSKKAFAYFFTTIILGYFSFSCHNLLIIMAFEQYDFFCMFSSFHSYTGKNSSNTSISSLYHFFLCSMLTNEHFPQHYMISNGGLYFSFLVFCVRNHFELSKCGKCKRS